MNTREVVRNYFDAIITGEFEKAGQFKSPNEQHWISGEGSWSYGGIGHPAIRIRRPESKPDFLWIQKYLVWTPPGMRVAAILGQQNKRIQRNEKNNSYYGNILRLRRVRR